MCIFTITLFHGSKTETDHWTSFENYYNFHRIKRQKCNISDLKSVFALKLTSYAASWLNQTKQSIG